MDLQAFQLDTCIVNEEFASKVSINELRETPENLRKGIDELRRLLEEYEQENPGTCTFPKDNQLWLINFLRICKFYPISARDRVSLSSKK